MENDGIIEGAVKVENGLVDAENKKILKCEFEENGVKCGRECKSIKSLCVHIIRTHSIILKKYYDKYFKKEGEGICILCGEKAKYINLRSGYDKCCLIHCLSQNKVICQFEENGKKCGKECKDFLTLSQHIRRYHSKITLKKYYNDYLKIKNSTEGICLTCGKNTNFGGLRGYSRFCSSICSNNSPKVKELKKETNQKNCGHNNWSSSTQGKLFHRITAFKWIEINKLNNEPLMPNIGPKERECLNEFQKHTIFKIIRNDRNIAIKIGRFPDGHVVEIRLFINFDEVAHFLDKECKIYKQDDLDCTVQLESLDYTVFRVSELDWKNNREKVIEKFKSLVQVLTEKYIK